MCFIDAGTGVVGFQKALVGLLARTDETLSHAWNGVDAQHQAKAYSKRFESAEGFFTARLLSTSRSA